MAHDSHSTGVLHGHGDVHEAHHHPQPIVYYKTFGWLILLLIVTVGAYYVDFSERTHWVGTNLIIALCIAAIKAALVVLYFMNVKFSSRLTWLWAAIGFIWMLLMSGIFLDYQTRVITAPAGWQ